jgi:hypothetical protein
LNLAAIHLKLLDVFHPGFKKGLDGDGGWRLLRTTASTVGIELTGEFKPGEHGFTVER